LISIHKLAQSCCPTLSHSRAVFPTWKVRQTHPKCIYLTVLTYLFHGAQFFSRTQPVLSQSRNSPHIMEPEGSLPLLQEPPNLPYLEPVQAIPCPLKSHFYKFHSNIVLPSTPGFLTLSLSLRFSHHNPLCNSSLPHTRYMPCPSHSS
jgi:hypothetical protein